MNISCMVVRSTLLLLIYTIERVKFLEITLKLNHTIQQLGKKWKKATITSTYNLFFRIKKDNRINNIKPKLTVSQVIKALLFFNYYEHLQILFLNFAI